MRDDDDLEAHLIDAGDVPADWVQRMVARLPDEETTMSDWESEILGIGFALDPATWPEDMRELAQAFGEEEAHEIDRACELSRLRDGIGTPDELADYDAARRMRLSGE